MKLETEKITLEEHEYTITADSIRGSDKPVKILLNGKDVSNSCVGLIMVKREGLESDN